MNGTKVWAVAAVLALSLGNGVWADSAQNEYKESVELSFPLNPGGEFSLSNRNGPLELTTWEKNEVRIVAEKRMRLEDGAISWLWRLLGLKSEEVKTDEDARKLFAELKIEATGDDVRRDVATVYPESTSGVNFSVAYTVTAPKNVNVRADLTNGAIQLSQVVGDVDVQSTNGSVSLDDVAGRVEARSTNGRVNVDRANGDVVARTTNGSVSVQLADGSIGAAELKSVNGNVALYVPDGAAFRIEGKTVHGGVSCELPLDAIDEQSNKELRGSAGTGGPLYSLRTTNGSVRVKRIGAE